MGGVEISTPDDGVVQGLDSFLQRTKTVQLSVFLSRSCLVLDALNTEDAIDVEYAPGHTNKSMAVCYDVRQTQDRVHKRVKDQSICGKRRRMKKGELCALLEASKFQGFFSRLRFADRLCR